MTSASPRPASSLLLLRPRKDDGVPELFFVKRHAKSRFMPNAYVFPGGRVEAQDSGEIVTERLGRQGLETLVSRMFGISSSSDASAHLVAAIRETFEEAGVFLGDFSGTSLDTFRQALLDTDGQGFEGLLTEYDAHLRGDALVYFAHWVTPEAEKRRYDARFFVAEAPLNQSASHDDIETTDSCWLSAQAALEAYQEGALSLAPPTWRILKDVASFPNVKAVMDWARSLGEVVPIMPTMTHEEGELVLALPGDRLHHEQPGSGLRRIVLQAKRWFYDERP